MPYEVKKEGKKYETVTEGTGKVHGTFPTREKALAQLRALYVHAPPEEEHAAGGEVGAHDCPCGMCRGGEAYAMGGEIPPLYQEGAAELSKPHLTAEEDDGDDGYRIDDGDEDDEDEDSMYARALRRYRR